MSWKAKHTQVADIMRSLLMGGEWHGVLPGYRVLEDLLKVSRSTIEKALAELTEEGLLSEAEVGKSRKILAAAADVASSINTKGLLILGATPVSELPWRQQCFMGEVTDSARNDGWRVAYDHFAFQEFKNPGGHLERLVKNHYPDRVLILQATAPVVKWFQSRSIPCFCLGGSVLSIVDEIDGAGCSAIGSVGVAAQHLHDHGHQRIMFPIPPMYRAARDALIDQALKGWGRSLSRPEIGRLTPTRESTDPEVVHARWRKWISEEEPTAMIVQASYDLLSLIGFCHKAGIRIPADLSVLCLSWDPSLRWTNPEVTAMVEPIEGCVKWAARWLRTPAGTHLGWRMFDTQLKVGKTVVRPRGQPKASAG